MRPFRYLYGAIATLIALAASLDVTAQNDLTQRQQRLLEQSMHMVTPMSGQMSRIAMEVQLELLAQPETAHKLAAFSHNYYQALVKAGFTEDQALQIVVRAGIPMLPPASTGQ
jgi:hypothetical protein